MLTVDPRPHVQLSFTDDGQIASVQVFVNGKHVYGISGRPQGEHNHARCWLELLVDGTKLPEAEIKKTPERVASQTKIRDYFDKQIAASTTGA